MEDDRTPKPAGLILARCAEILDRVDEALGAERYDETASLLAESQIRLSALSSGIRADVDPQPGEAYADLAVERVRLQDLLQRTEEILEQCRRKRAESLEALRQIRSGQRFTGDGNPDPGGWTDRVC